MTIAKHHDKFHDKIHASVFTVRVNVITATVNFAAPARAPPAFLKLLLFPSFFSEHGLMQSKRPWREDEYPDKKNKNV
jgi:hypothetical protein